MIDEAFADTVRSDNETALSRLGSSKALYAATGGEMEPEPVLSAAAVAADGAAAVFEAWADDADGDAADAFAAAAAVEADHGEAVAAELDGEVEGDEPALVAALRDLDGPVARAGGYVGWALATGKAAEQYTGFFVGRADPATARLFRGYGDDVDDHLARALDLLDAVATGDDDREAARAAAGDVVRAAYEEYTERLESMGVNPKPVC